MSATIETTLRQAVEDAAAELYVWSLKDIPRDLRDALGDALERETHQVGRRILETIHTNVAVADEGRRLVCQDTGIAVYYVRVGEQFPLHPVRIEEALRDGTRRATLDHPLRSNTVHTLTRKPTGDNTGHRIPHVHWEFVPDWDGLDIKCVPKGSGSENMSFLKMLVPADGVKAIKAFVLDCVVGAGGKPCPPGIVGVGIGGSADLAMYLAKEAIARPVGTHNQDPDVAALEGDLFDLLNETGVGPMGLGGDTTVLSVHVEQAHTHITLNPVAVNYQCWAARRATAHVSADGEVEPGQGRVARWPTTRSPSRPTRRPCARSRPATPSRSRATSSASATPRRSASSIRARSRRCRWRAPRSCTPRRTSAGSTDGRYEPLSIGTTTSARMSRFTEPLIRDHGARAIMGKGGLLPEALGPLAEHGGVYLAIVGGAAALQTTQIVEIEQVEWEDLMPECLWRFRVADFGPLIVAMDTHGKSLYEDVQVEARRRIADSLSAKL